MAGARIAQRGLEAGQRHLGAACVRMTLAITDAGQAHAIAQGGAGCVALAQRGQDLAEQAVAVAHQFVAGAEALGPAACFANRRHASCPRPPVAHRQVETARRSCPVVLLPTRYRLVR